MAIYSSHRENKQFFAENQEGDRFPITFHKGMVIISTKWGKVIFTKTNRSHFYRDSRDGKMLSAMEVKAELTRLLTKEQAEAAFCELSA